MKYWFDNRDCSSKVDEHWHRRDWPYERLLMTDGRYVEDLTVQEIAEFLWSQGAR